MVRFLCRLLGFPLFDIVFLIQLCLQGVLNTWCEVRCVVQKADHLGTPCVLRFLGTSHVVTKDALGVICMYTHAATQDALGKNESRPLRTSLLGFPPYSE